MSTQSSETLLASEIAAHLPKLEQQVRQHELSAVARAALAQGDASPEGFLRLAAEYGTRVTARRERLFKLRSAYAEAQTPKRRTGVILAALQEEEAPSRTLSAAKRGWLDLDAMTERAELDVHELWARQGLALRAAAALASGDAIASVVQTLLDYVLSSPPPLVSVAAAEALLELIVRLPERIRQEQVPVDKERWVRLGLMLADPSTPRRVQAALLRLCLQAVPEAAYRVVGERLQVVASPADFIMRQHIVVLLGQRRGDIIAFGLLVTTVRYTDPSEHVRIALPAALRATGGADAVPFLTQLAGTAAAPGDKSARVRAAAVIALSSLLHDREANTSALLLFLLNDPDPLVYRTVAQEVQDLALKNRLSETEALAFSAAVTQRAMQSQTTKQATPAMLAQEALANITDGPLALARSMLAPRLSDMVPGEVVEVATAVPPATFGRLLAQLARKGFGYYAQAIAGGYRVERAPRLVPQAWRILHELRRRSPYKRQDGVHTVGRQFIGTLRAHSDLLAEATSTAVPGEPLASPSDGAWGPHLPTVDDLLSIPLVGAAPVTLFSGRGVTKITPPKTLFRRMRAWLNLTTRYAALAEERLHSIDPGDPSESTSYVESLKHLGFQVELSPYPAAGGGAGSLVPSVAAPLGLGAVATGAPAALAVLGAPEGMADLVRYFLSPAENTLEQLGVAALVACVVMFSANIARRQQIRRDRAAVPLVIGGWGTRGKSGTERLKAALLHALDLDVLVKTTGCEAMFIHGVPGRKPTEIFIHRSYDKATIWEQADVLNLAARLHTQVFLWECMALSGPLVRVLSEEWMQDDVQTLTNAYPDHEDIQGPAGQDVARSIAGFIRSGGTTITTEEQMLPVLAEEARKKGARLISVPIRDHELLADDLLARFPYKEHPNNIALVRRLAVHWGLDPDLATADMADNVVPDLGVLKAYPTAHHQGRHLIFVNGMSANERTGFLSNWQHTGCERAVDQPGKWVVTVVNNRYDRVARSKVFADVLVHDASAERHVLIGTNLSGLRVYIEESLTHFLRELHLFHLDQHPGQSHPHEGEELSPQQAAALLHELLRVRCDRMRHRLRIGLAEPAAVLAELQAWRDGADVSAVAGVVQEALASAAQWADAEESLVSIEAKLHDSPLAAALAALPRAEKVAEERPEEVAEWMALQQELLQYTCRSIARRALIASLQRAAERAISDPAQQQVVIARQDRLYRELFMELLVIIEDSGASGDQIIHSIAHACPPGIEATVMGIQNIKGTGLDFVYRWIRYDEVTTLVEKLAVADGDEAHNLAATLVSRTDFGMLDSALAQKAVAQAAVRLAGTPGLGDYLRDTATQLAEIAARCKAALRTGKKQRRNPAVRLVEKLLDTADAVRRRWRSDAILDALVHREMSHERAALESRRLVDREKKGWLRK